MMQTTSALKNEYEGASEPRPIQTTLYALVEAVMEEVGPEEDTLVTQVVLGLLGKGGMH
jgi:hypothetical protein